MSVGEILEWTDEKLEGNRERMDFETGPLPIRIVTDAAGSLTREDARRLGISLLDSYVMTENDCIPETLADRRKIYEDLKNGRKLTTSQASAFEIGQNLQRVSSLGDRILYLCVGSVYTGNYRTATEWKKQNDPEDRLTVMDTGAASGRLACMAMATAEFAKTAESATEVVRFAVDLSERVEEYIFPEKLRYLARSGRLSKAGAFVGDMVGLMPVVSPTAQGAKTVGAAMNAKARIAFVLEKLKKARETGGVSFVMLEYSDNSDWVENVVKRRILETFPEIVLVARPLSLTSGVHIGPGAWAAAFVKNEA
jgi:DegV family protein with EDD domain